MLRDVSRSTINKLYNFYEVFLSDRSEADKSLLILNSGNTTASTTQGSTLGVATSTSKAAATSTTAATATTTPNTTTTGASASTKAASTTAASTTAASANSTNSTNSTTAGTNVFQGKENSSNALGLVGPSNYSISQTPYIVKRCDQVLLIPAERITDYKNYCKKESAFFTMSIYMINVFESQDSNKLLQSIPLDKITNMPTHLTGAPGCIDFQAEDNRISICVKTDELVDQLIEAYMAFSRCRKGDNLDWRSMMKILQECMLGHNNMNSTMINSLGFQNMTSTSTSHLPTMSSFNSAKKNGQVDINPYYSDLKVPGS